jgi:hypothetical protein
MATQTRAQGADGKHENLAWKMKASEGWKSRKVTTGDSSSNRNPQRSSGWNSSNDDGNIQNYSPAKVAS